MIPEWDYPTWEDRAFLAVVDERDAGYLYLRSNLPYATGTKMAYGETYEPGFAFRFETWDAAHAAIDDYIPDGPDEGHINPHVTQWEPRYRTLEGRPAMFATVYNVGQGYGGPEEGGWWFNTGTVELVVPTDEEHGEDVQAQLLERFSPTGKRSSVLGGADYEVHLGYKPGRDFPECTPRYE